MWKKVGLYLWHHRTSTFGDLQLIVSIAVSTTGLIPDDKLKWALFANAVLTQILGRYNNRKAPAPPSGTE